MTIDRGRLDQLYAEIFFMYALDKETKMLFCTLTAENSNGFWYGSAFILSKLVGL